MEPAPIDVIIIGYGPVGQALSLMLAQQNRRVMVVERKSEPYPLPRAVCMDHEIRRVLLALGCGDVIEHSARPSPTYRWLNAAHEELLNIDWTVEAVSGGPEAYFFHQPSLEAALQNQAAAHPNIDIRLGWELSDLVDDGNCVSATIHSRSGGVHERVCSRFLVGADGANSFVRRTMGIGQEDFGFEADWLVVDVSAGSEADFTVNGAVQICDPARPTTMVPGGICAGRVYRRWEFMRLPGESKEMLEHPDMVWTLLEPWVDRTKVELHKHIVYTFRSLVAKHWRQGRILLAGDAAHVMPPFMGQGMCSGLRDDWNLVWKLGMVLDGRCNDTLLDTYETERKDHVAAVIDASVALGRIICVADKADAAARDNAFLSGNAPPMAPFPSLGTGFIARDRRFSHLAGQLAPHGDVIGQNGSRRLDDAIGRRFLLLVREQAEAHRLAAALALNASLAESIAIIGPDDLVAPLSPLLVFLETHQLAALLARPDFYIYGTAPIGETAQQLVDVFAEDLNVYLIPQELRGTKSHGEPILIDT